MLAVIGSTALYEHNIPLLRKRSDVDLIGDYDSLIAFFQDMRCSSIIPFAEGKKLVARGKYIIYEAEIAWDGSTSKELFDLIVNDPNSLKIDRNYYASLNVCYMLKMTHRFKKNSPHFKKTMDDILAMRKLGATIQPEHKEFFKRREAETYNYKHPKLNQSKKDFFTDDVPYVYDHDSIHRAIALNEKPAYEFYKPDTKEVYTSRKLFFKQSLAIQLAGVYEESCVLALERSQIPYPEMDRRKSFEIALMKVCTSITSGWFREFAWEHYNQVMVLYDYQTQAGNNYKDVFDRALAKGNIIQPHGTKI